MATKKNKVVQRTRRGNGEGSIYQEKDGSWRGAIRFEQSDGTKVRKKVSGHSYEEVSKKLVELTGKMNILKNSSLTDKTFGDLFQEWLLIFKKSAVSPRTFEGNIRNYKNHIEPLLGNMKIEDVTVPVVQQVINEMLAKDLSTNTAKKVKFLLNQFFEYATDCEWVLNNPTLKVKIRNRETYNKENEYKAIPQEIRMKFLTALNNTTLLKPICMTAMFAGLRIGEILALRWENIDFENKTISVEHALTQIPQFDKKGKVLSRKTIVSDTKTACSVREVPVPDISLDALKDWKKQQWVKQQLTGAELLKPTSIVFSNDDGSVRSYYGTRCIFNRFAKNMDFMEKCISTH